MLNTPEKVNGFMAVLLKTSSLGGEFDSGLIIIEDLESEPTISFQDIAKEIKKSADCQMVTNQAEFLANLLIANSNNIPIVINIDRDLDSLLLNNLKTICETNSFSDNFDFTKRTKLNKRVRVVCIAKRSLIEQAISYRSFYDLFGPVLSI